MSDYEQGTGGRAGIEQQRATSLTAVINETLPLRRSGGLE